MSHALTDRVLILDDQVFIGETVVRMLGECHYESEFTTQPSEFFGWVASGRFSHLIIDLVMPEMNGEQVIMMLARMKCKLPIIIMSGGESSLLKSAAIAAQEQGLWVLGTLTKPFFKDALLAMLELKRRQTDLITPSDNRAAQFDAVDIKFALSRRQFYCVYQPKLNLITDEVVGFECLLRWERPDYGLIPPDLFIPKAEATGVIDTLTYFTIRESLAWLARLQSVSGNSSITMAINLSALSIPNAYLIDTLQNTCKRYGIHPEQVILEVTERVAIDDSLSTLQQLMQLRFAGFKLAVDDFGTGYASLKQIARLPFSELKIDRSFINTLTQSHESHQITRTTIELAQSLNLQVVAEGAEDYETIDKLKSLGCQQVQGFYHAKPMSAAQAEHWYLRKLSNETARRTRVFDTVAANNSVRFSYVTEFIHEFLGFEIVLVSLLEKSTVYLRAPIGLNVECVAIENSLCLHVMNNNDITVFEDLRQLPEVTKGMLSSMRERVRFYAGFPFWSANNLFIGSVCVMNSKPHQLSQREYRTLSQLARLVEFDIAHSLIPRESEQTSLAFSFKRLNRITDIARDLNLNVTLIRVTFAHPDAELSSMEALSQRIRPWDTLTRLSDKAVLLTLQHRASHIDIADICQRVFAFNSASAGLLQVEAETFNASSIAHIQTMLLALKPQPLTGLLVQ